MTVAQAKPELALHRASFLPEYLLARYIDLGFVRRVGPRQIATPSQAYVLQDAVRVLGLRSHDSDPFGLTGHVSSLRALIERGFRVERQQLSWGRYHYDMEFGFLIHPAADADVSGARPALSEEAIPSSA